MPIGLEGKIVDQHIYDRAVARLRDARVYLPKLAELAEPATLQESYRRSLTEVGPDEPDARNLYRVHWHNAADRHALTDTPEHVSLPKALTGVDARIVEHIVVLALHADHVGVGRLVCAGHAEDEERSNEDEPLHRISPIEPTPLAGGSAC